MIVAPADYLQQSPFPIEGAQLVVEVIFETRTPWPVRVDLPRLIARRARMMRIEPA